MPNTKSKYKKRVREKKGRKGVGNVLLKTQNNKTVKCDVREHKKNFSRRL